MSGAGARRCTRLLCGSLVALLLTLTAAAPAAQAETEPNNELGLAEGSIAGGVTYAGSLVSGPHINWSVNGYDHDSDEDWYGFHVNGQVELDIAVETGPVNCGDPSVALLRSTDLYEAERVLDQYVHDSEDRQSGTARLRYTTPPGLNRFYLRLTGCSLYDNDRVDYSFRIEPSASVVAAPLPFSGPQPVAEPNDSSAQAFGPLRAGRAYEGGTEPGDVDWLYFYARPGRQVRLAMTSRDRCSVPASGGEDDDTAVTILDGYGSPIVAGGAPGPGVSFLSMHSFASTIRRYDVRIGCGDTGYSYLLRIEPADALAGALPSPAAIRCRAAKRVLRGSKAKLKAARRALRRADGRRAKRRQRRELRVARRTLRRADGKVRRVCG